MNENRKKRRTLTCVLLVIGILLIVSRNVKADFVFGESENLGPSINTWDYEWFPRLESDGLSLHFIRNLDEWENWVATRATKNDPWDTVVQLEGRPNWYASFGIVPGVTPMDGLEVYIWAGVDGGYGNSDIYVKTRETLDSPLSPTLTNVGPLVNTQSSEFMPSISPNGLELFFSDYAIELIRPNGYGGDDLWVAKRATRDDPWEEPVNLGPQVNSAANDSRLHISADGLLLFFDSWRSGGQGGSDLYMTKRKSLSDSWGEAMNLGPNVNSLGSEYNPCISADGRTLIFVRNEDLWQATVEPVVDLNGDSIVDCADMCMVVDNWGTDNSLSDIGPMPWGDGIVDVQDLIVLAEHLFEEFPPSE
jgi:hypothetical protein